MFDPLITGSLFKILSNYTISLLNLQIFKLHESLSFVVSFRCLIKLLSRQQQDFATFPNFHTHCNNDEQYLLLLFIKFTSIIQIFTALIDLFQRSQTMKY